MHAPPEQPVPVAEPSPATHRARQAAIGPAAVAIVGMVGVAIAAGIGPEHADARAAPYLAPGASDGAPGARSELAPETDPALERARRRMDRLPDEQVRSDHWQMGGAFLHDPGASPRDASDALRDPFEPAEPDALRFHRSPPRSSTP